MATTFVVYQKFDGEIIWFLVGVLFKLPERSGYITAAVGFRYFRISS